MVLFDGMDNAKEMSVIFAGLDFAKRGINTLAIDGPGQAEALRLRNIHARHDYEAAGIPAYDYVASRPEVDAKRVAVMGYSFGGYHAPRICAFEKRYAACVCFGAMHKNVYEFVKGHAPTDPRQTTASTFQFRWVTGAPDNATALEWAKRYTLEERRPPGHLPGADPARRERPHRAGRTPPRRSTSGSARRTRRCGFSPKPRAAPSTARSTTASSASTSSATGC